MLLLPYDLLKVQFVELKVFAELLVGNPFGGQIAKSLLILLDEIRLLAHQQVLLSLQLYQSK